MNEYTVQAYFANIYIGSAEGYGGRKFFEHELIIAVSEFQKALEAKPIEGIASLVSVRITPTIFLVKDYMEDGWEISAINYPGFRKEPKEIQLYMEMMAKYLLKKFNQNRVTLMTSDFAVTFEKEDAEEHPPQNKPV